MPQTNSQLETAMERRRVELRMSWRDVSNAAGMSYEGLRAIRRGDRHPMAVTQAKIEEALHWAPGSVEAILADPPGEPTPREIPEPQETAPLSSLDREELVELRASLVKALERIDRIQRGAG